MSKKKKHGKGISLIVLCVLVIGMFAAYKMMDAQQKNVSDDTADTGDDVIMLIDRTSDAVAEITYRLGEGETLALLCSASTGVWVYADEPQFPLNQTTVGTMAAAICRIGAYRQLESGDTGEYGFDAPALTVSVKYTDGDAHSYAIGDVNPVSGYRYFKDLDTGAVYTIAAALYDYFNYTLDDMFVYDTLPEDIEADYITSFELSGDTVTDADGIASLYEIFTALAPSAYADSYADEEEADEYGIGSLTLTVSYKRAVEISDDSGNTSTTRIPATFAISFGDTAEDGRVYYKLSASDVVYLADAETVNALRDAFLPAESETEES